MELRPPLVMNTHLHDVAQGLSTGAQQYRTIGDHHPWDSPSAGGAKEGTTRVPNAAESLSAVVSACVEADIIDVVECLSVDVTLFERGEKSPSEDPAVEPK